MINMIYPIVKLLVMQNYQFNKLKLINMKKELKLKITILEGVTHVETE